MSAASLGILNLRLADACRVEHHGRMLLEALAANVRLPRSVRDRADMHLVETRAQLNEALAALQILAPSLARLENGVEAIAGQPGIEHWKALERREISAYQGVLAYCHDSPIEGLSRTCAAAIDLQRSVLLWLESDPAGNTVKSEPVRKPTRNTARPAAGRRPDRSA